MTRARIFGLVAAVLMVAVGGWWTSKGLGWFGDAPTHDDAVWYATVGPALAGLGIALGVVIARGPQRH